MQVENTVMTEFPSYIPIRNISTINVSKLWSLHVIQHVQKMFDSHTEQECNIYDEGLVIMPHDGLRVLFRWWISGILLSYVFWYPFANDATIWIRKQIIQENSQHGHTVSEFQASSKLGN